MLRESIAALDDEAAVGRLMGVVLWELRGGKRMEPLTPPLAVAIGDLFGIAANDQACSEGDLARTALELLASTEGLPPAGGVPLESRPRNQRYGAVEVVGLLTAAMFVLQTQLEIQLKGGKWTFRFKKRPASDELLRTLVQMVINSYSGTRRTDRQLPPGSDADDL